MVRDCNEMYHRYRRMCELAGLPLHPPLVWPVDVDEMARLINHPDILNPLFEYISKNSETLKALEPL